MCRDVGTGGEGFRMPIALPDFGRNRIKNFSLKRDLGLLSTCPPDFHIASYGPDVCLDAVHTESFDWFLSGLEWILNLEFCLLKLLTFYQKLLWNIRSRLNSSTFWVFRPVFRYDWSKLKLFAYKMKILINHMYRTCAFITRSWL